MPKQIEEFNKEHFTRINLQSNIHQLGNTEFHLFAAHFGLQAQDTKSGKSLRLEFYIGRTIHYVYTILPDWKDLIDEDFEMATLQEELILHSDEY